MKKANKKVNAAIVIIGNEILSGRTQDVNVSFLTKWLNNLGVINLDLKNSWMIGDKINDLKAAYSKGLKGGILVMTGYGKEEKKKLDQLPKKNFIIKTAPSLNKVKITF